MATPLKPPACAQCGSDQVTQLDVRSESSGGLSSDSGIIRLRYTFKCNACGMAFTHSVKDWSAAQPPAKESIKNIPEMKNRGN